MKAIRFAAVLGVVGVGCTATQTEVKKDAPVVAKTAQKTLPEVFAEGVAAFDAGRYDEARAAFSAVAEKAPSNVVVHYNLGVLAERQGRLSDAVTAYELAHKLDVHHKPTLLNLGRAYRLQDKFNEAIALYEEAIKEPANEYDVELNNNLTVAYRLAKKFDRAEASARKVLARTKDNPDAYKNLSLIYFDQGNYRLAEFISANARKLDDKDPGVYNNLGLIYLKLDDRRLALGQFQKAVALNKDFAPSLFNIGAMALSYRDYESAEKVLARATELEPNSYESFLAYAWALDGQKTRDPKKGLKAGEVFEKVLSIKTGHNEAVCGAAWAYASDKAGWDKALTFFDKCKAIAGAQDQQQIDGKVKSILALQKSGQTTALKTDDKDKAKAAAPKSGTSMIDKVSDDAAKQEAASPAPDAAPEKPSDQPAAPADKPVEKTSESPPASKS